MSIEDEVVEFKEGKNLLEIIVSGRDYIRSQIF